MTDETPTKVIHIAAAVVTDDAGRLLVVRKRGTTAFMQPGGKIDAGESASAALRREISEELGVTVVEGSVHHLGTHVAPAANEPDHLVHADLFRVKLRGEPRAGAEIDELSWIDPLAPGAIELAPLTEHTVLGLVG